MTISTVLDASAVIALLFGEPGADRVDSAIEEAAISSVNLSEVVGRFARDGMPEDKIRIMIGELRIEHVPFDAELAYLAGLWLPIARPAGISFGDRACLALAKRLAVPALTADRSWMRVAERLGVKVELIR